MNRTLLGTLLTVASAGSSALLPIFTLLAYQAGLAVFDVLAWRFILAAIVIWLAFPLWHQQAKLGSLSRREVAILLGMGALFSICALTAFLALARVNATTYIMLFYTYPSMVALFSFLLGERLPLTSWIAVGLALIGCVLAAGEGLIVESLWDIALPLINAAAMALYTVVAGHYTEHITGLTSGFIVITTSFVIVAVASIFYGLGLPPSLDGWLAMLGISMLSTIVAIVGLLAGIAYIGPSRAAIVSTVNPPIAVILAAAVLGEKAEWFQYMGGLLILASVLLLQLGNNNQDALTEAGDDPASSENRAEA
ncbi:MAG: DMT family transporter [Anaerolineae bacterium]|nr:DMT family transporter [Anaerolineae bacterium]